MIYNIYMRMIIVFVIVIVLLHAFSCSRYMNKKDDSKVYKMDIYFRYFDPDTKSWRESEGMFWLPKKTIYNIEMIASEKINLLSFRSCSREVIVENPKSWTNRKKFIYYYDPNIVESSGACPAEVSAVNKDGYFFGGYLDFQDDVSNLPAINVCGETTDETIGINLCQGRVNSVEKIIFPVEVQAAPEPGCELSSPLKGTEFTYKIKPGRCLYIFKEIDGKERIARLTTHGYNAVNLEF